MLRVILCVFLGSGIGGVMRYLVSLAMQSMAGPSRWMFPWSTLTVNVAGCFIFGLIYGISIGSGISKEWKLGLTTGFCGGLTTFSTFSYETLTLVAEGHVWSGLGYALVSLVAGVAAAWAGYWLTR